MGERFTEEDSGAMTEKQTRPLSPKVSAPAVGGGGAGALIAWLWSVLLPDMPPMDPSISPIIGSAIGGVIGYFVRD